MGSDIDFRKSENAKFCCKISTVHVEEHIRLTHKDTSKYMCNVFSVPEVQPKSRGCHIILSSTVCPHFKHYLPNSSSHLVALDILTQLRTNVHDRITQ